MRVNNSDVKAVETIDDVKRYISQTMSQVVQILNGKLTFQDNQDARIVSVNFTSSGVDFPVNHNLGRQAVGYFLVTASSPMSIYNGQTASTDANLFLRTNNTGSATILVF